ncbi:unnamed protein product [Blepharisma stoltei]|uniref:Secreted protein n=1 Tax=Blepharisma stoltei TaxID=1481888 RepID=A0AAU9J181_9CILI|nr:unnamed protein product [Blepharisma stoltei]
MAIQLSSPFMIAAANATSFLSTPLLAIVSSNTFLSIEWNAFSDLKMCNRCSCSASFCFQLWFTKWRFGQYNTYPLRIHLGPDAWYLYFWYPKSACY